MTLVSPPEWLRTFEDAFLGALTTPLPLVGRALIVPSGREQVSQYRKQYWFRLFNTAQADLPLTTAVHGPTIVNLLVHRIVGELSLDAHNLEDLWRTISHAISNSSAPLAALSPRGETRLRETLQVDFAFATVRCAPEVDALESLPVGLLEDSALENVVFEPRPSWVLINARKEDMDCSVRHEPASCSELDSDRETPAATPWLLSRKGTSTMVIPLSPAQASFYAALRECSLGDALDVLLTMVSEDELAGSLGEWLSTGLSLGLWQRPGSDDGCALREIPCAEDP
jgi:hypothetical protein